MTQEEVKIVIMNAYPNEINIAELCKKLNLNRASISRCCKKLREQNDKQIEFKKLARREYRYKWKK